MLIIGFVIAGNNQKTYIGYALSKGLKRNLIMSTKSVVTSVTLPRKLKAEVEAYAKELGVPMATIIRRALIKYLDRHALNVEEQKAA